MGVGTSAGEGMATGASAGAALVAVGRGEADAGGDESWRVNGSSVADADGGGFSSEPQAETASAMARRKSANDSMERFGMT